MIELPIYALQSYEYTIILNDIYWRIKILYNPRASQWTVTIEYDSTEEVLIAGIPLLTGVDVLYQYRAEGNRFGKLMLWNESDNYADATFENISDYSLYYFLPNESIPDRFNLIQTNQVERTAIVSKATIPAFTPSI